MDLEAISPAETARARVLVQSLIKWLESAPGKENVERYNVALKSVHEALLATREYQKGRADGKPRIPESEHQLSRLWYQAHDRIREFDVDLAERCCVKGHGWADERVWHNPKYKHLTTKLDDMLNDLINLEKRGSPDPKPIWFSVLAAIFLFLTLLSLFYLIIRTEDIGVGKGMIFNVWVALCVAASAYFIGGTARASGKIPWLKVNAPLDFLAVGGIGVFVITLLILINRLVEFLDSMSDISCSN